MPAATLSIIIPTFNRRKTLEKTIQAYLSQTAVSQILEILVVDDGSSDDTKETISSLRDRTPTPVRYFRLENRGPAAARNIGILEARGAIILFGDDDIVPVPTLVAEHLAWHTAYPHSTVGVLGRVAWAPELRATPFMEWLGSEGVLFGFARLSPGNEVDVPFTLFCNTSLKARLLRGCELFDERLRFFEDRELGFRLHKRGFRLLYNPSAVGYHYKRISLADTRRRAESSVAAYEAFQTTEAGMCMKQSPAGEHGVEPKPPWARRIIKWLAITIVPLLRPLLPVLETRIPLPWALYRLLYRHYVEMEVYHGLDRSPL